MPKISACIVAYCDYDEVCVQQQIELACQQKENPHRRLL